MTVEEFAGSCRQIGIHAWDFKVIESKTDDQLFNSINDSLESILMFEIEEYYTGEYWIPRICSFLRGSNPYEYI